MSEKDPKFLIPADEKDMLGGFELLIYVKELEELQEKLGIKEKKPLDVVLDAMEYQISMYKKELELKKRDE